MVHVPSASVRAFEYRPFTAVVLLVLTASPLTEVPLYTLMFTSLETPSPTLAAPATTTGPAPKYVIRVELDGLSIVGLNCDTLSEVVRVPLTD